MSRTQWDKTVLSPVLSRGQKSHLRFCPGDKNHTFGFVPGTQITPFFGSPHPVVGNDNAAASQRLSILAASTNYFATTAASAGDNNDNNNKVNKPSMQAGTDADGGGQRQPNDYLILAWQELVSSNANIHGGRTTSSNNVTNTGGGAVGNTPGRVHRQQSAKKRQQ